MSSAVLGFAKLLDWHLRHGTRPDGQGVPWTNKTFAGALRITIHERSVGNWRHGRHVPNAIDHIEQALFGTNDTTQYREWRRQLRASYAKVVRGLSESDGALVHAAPIAHEQLPTSQSSAAPIAHDEDEDGNDAWPWLINLAFGYASFLRFFDTAAKKDDKSFTEVFNWMLEPMEHLRIDCGPIPVRSKISEEWAVELGEEIKKKLRMRSVPYATVFNFCWRFFHLSNLDGGSTPPDYASKAKHTLLQIGRDANLLDDFSKAAIQRLFLNDVLLNDEFIDWAYHKRPLQF